MTNNLDLIKPLLKFESKDDFYYLQILQRKKDPNPVGLVTGSNNNARAIKNYYINSLEYLERKMPEIIALCNLFNARASLRLNKRSYSKVAYRSLQKIAGILANGEYSHLKTAYSKACGLSHNAGKTKTWVVDLDTDEELKEDFISKLLLEIKGIQPEGEKLVAILPTKSGKHLITKPFNLEVFRDLGYSMDIHKDNPTNLYIP
jgi:hypothetical protein